MMIALDEGLVGVTRLSSHVDVAMGQMWATQGVAGIPNVVGDRVHAKWEAHFVRAGEGCRGDEYVVTELLRDRPN